MADEVDEYDMGTGDGDGDNEDADVPDDGENGILNCPALDGEVCFRTGFVHIWLSRLSSWTRDNKDQF